MKKLITLAKRIHFTDEQLLRLQVDGLAKANEYISGSVFKEDIRATADSKLIPAQEGWRVTTPYFTLDNITAAGLKAIADNVDGFYNGPDKPTSCAVAHLQEIVRCVFVGIPRS